MKSSYESIIQRNLDRLFSADLKERVELLHFDIEQAVQVLHLAVHLRIFN